MKKEPTKERWEKYRYQLQNKDIESKLSLLHDFLAEHSSIEFPVIQRVGTDEWDEEMDDSGRRGMHGTNDLGIEIDLVVIRIPKRGTYMLRCSIKESAENICALPNVQEIVKNYDSYQEEVLQKDEFYEDTREDFIRLTKKLMKLDKYR